MKYKIILFLRFFLTPIPYAIRRKLLIVMGELFNIRVIARNITSDPDKNGENYFLRKKISELLRGKQDFIVFDVGANVGNYTQTIKSMFTGATVYAFEPNHYTYQQLLKNTTGLEKVTAINKGLGAQRKKEKIYTYAGENASEHSSISKEVFLDLHKSKEVVELDFEMEVLDLYCHDNAIRQIDFLKIDVEGYEMEVLKGAKRMLSEGNIRIIQFEFNSMNVVTRVFLKDFYELLQGYRIYRLDHNRMELLSEYNPFDEQFYIQNFIAVCTF